MNNTALNILFARAEIFNRFEDLGSQLTPEEAEIASAYLENLIKTRPIRRPETGQVETNCEYCAVGNPRLKNEYGYYHEIDSLAPPTKAQQFFGVWEPEYAPCEAAHAQN